MDSYENVVIEKFEKWYNETSDGTFIIYKNREVLEIDRSTRERVGKVKREEGQKEFREG